MEEASEGDVIAARDVKTSTLIRRDHLVLEGMFIELIQQIYSDKANLRPGMRAWCGSNETINGLYITPAYEWDETSQERRPLIAVSIGDLDVNSRDISGLDRLIDANFEDSSEAFGRRVSSSVTFVHVGRTAGEVAQYCGTSYDILDAMALPIQRLLCLESFDVVKVTAPARRKQAPVEFHATVTAQFSFIETFWLKKEAPRLKQIIVDMGELADRRLAQVVR